LGTITFTMPLLEHAESLLRAGAHAEALHQLDSFVAQAELPDKSRLRALVLQSRAHQDSSNAEASLQATAEALELSRRLSDRSREAETLCLQASAYTTIGLKREGFDAAAQALTIARACDDKRMQARALLRLSNCAVGTGDEPEARRLLEQSLACAQAAASADDEFWALNNLSNLMGIEAARLAEGNDAAPLRAAVAELVATVERALAVARRTGHWLQQAFATSNLADAYIVSRDSQRARELINDYAELARRHGFNRLLAYAHLDEARLLRAEGRGAQAIAVLDSESHRSVVGATNDLTLSTEEALVQLHKEQGGFERALRHLENVVRLQRATLTGRAEQQTRVLMARIDVEQARAEAEQQALRARSLELERDLLHRSSRLDTLTGVGNRRAADEALAARLATVASGEGQFFVAFVDVDHFKLVNDTFGHAIGDRVLLALGDLMRGFLRNRDEVFRFGGEEFVLLMADAQPFAGYDACERLRLLIERHDWTALVPQLHVTASFGVARWQGEASVNELIARADAAMYRAKREGRNRVVQA
jgi:diguanylate cyclase (GGDEF)-like protein